MCMMVISIIVCAVGTSPKRLDELEIRERDEIIQTTKSLKLSRILRKVLGTWGDSYSSEWTLFFNTCGKNYNSKRIK